VESLLLLLMVNVSTLLENNSESMLVTLSSSASELSLKGALNFKLLPEIKVECEKFLLGDS
jgi:hypothetical protein